MWPGGAKVDGGGPPRHNVGVGTHDERPGAVPRAPFADDSGGDSRPLSETLCLTPHAADSEETGSIDPADLFNEDSVILAATHLKGDTWLPRPTIAPGEALQLTRYARRGNTLLITGLTPHGRRLTFEQREDRDGWYVVVAGRRRRPTDRELALVVASITREMEASMAPEGEDVRSAYRLAATSDQPGVEIHGLQAYRDLLLDEAAAYVGGQLERLAVVAVEYQAFKRFAIRHGHRIGAAFVRALGERLHALFKDEKKLHVCHKTGKSFRLVIGDRTAAEVQELVARVTSDETKAWLVSRVWGREGRTHPQEVHFYIGIAFASAEERQAEYTALAQRLNDDAFRAAKLGQLRGHPSVQHAKEEYQTTVYQWRRGSQEDLEELAASMDEGPGPVMAEMQDYLHELVPADIEGMAVEGDVHALIYRAIARDGFWQGTTAMRIAGDRIISRFMAGAPPEEGENGYVGGFDLGDEFYGIAVESGRLYFAWGDLNSAGATRLKGLHLIQQAVGWRRTDGGGVVGRFLKALAGAQDARPLVTRVMDQASAGHAELMADERFQVNDTVDIAGYLWTLKGEPVTGADLEEGSVLQLVLPEKHYEVRVEERRSAFIARLLIGGEPHLASISDAFTGPSIKLRVRDAVVAAAVCILEIRRHELEEMLTIVREDNHLPEDTPMDLVGFLRHVADILLAEQVKGPGKIRLALGEPYRATRFVRAFTLEEVRERHPGLFYEAVHHSLLNYVPLNIDRHLAEMLASTMLARTRPQPEP